MTRKILIGSRAARHWFEDFREPKDWDYITDYKNEDGRDAWIERINDEKHEFHTIWFCAGNRYILENTECDIVKPEFLYTLKLSTCFWPVFWEKTMWDIKYFQEKGVQHDETLFKIMYEEHTRIHGRKRANLKKTNDEFFKDAVKREYVHDDIHKAVAYYDAPLYESCKKDKNKAFINESLFNKLSYEDQLRMCREEIYVTALERFLIPKDFKINRTVAYREACKLLLTSMTKGWFPKFIALNWFELYKPDDNNFVDLFKTKLAKEKLCN